MQKKKLKDLELVHLCSTLHQEQKQEKKSQATGDEEEEEVKRRNAASKRLNMQRRGTGKSQQTVTSISKKLKPVQVDLNRREWSG